MQSEGEQHGDESGAAWVPGSDSWQHKDGCITPSLVLRLPYRLMQFAAGLGCGRTDRVEVIGFTLMLLGRRCPSLTPPQAEQGKENLLGPTDRSQGTATAHTGPAARRLSQGFMAEEAFLFPGNPLQQ